MKVALITTDENLVGAGVRVLSSCLIEQGFETVIVFMHTPGATYKGFRWQDIVDVCKDADLIAISCMTHGAAKAREVRCELQKKLDVPVVIGGMHASLAPESLIDDFALVCHGEGEDVITELAGRIKSRQPYFDIPGLWARRGDEVIKNQSRKLSRNINEYPFPDYDLGHQYVLEQDGLVRMQPHPWHTSFDYFVVLGSRGCPHHCTYCCNRKIKQEFPWRKTVAHYTVDYLIGHLKLALKAFPGIKSFWIDDDTFFVKSFEEIAEFAEKYKREIGRPFLILISPWTYNEKKVEIVINAGISKLIMGIQTGSENVAWNIYDRKISNDKIMEIAKSLNRYAGKMEIAYDFIGMNPFETRQDLVNTITFLRRLPQPFFIFNNNLAFYPGTEMHRRAIDSGLDVSRRIKHSEAKDGYEILRAEQINHKLFHLVILLMAGHIGRAFTGKLPRFATNKLFMAIYCSLDRHLPGVANAIAVLIRLLLMFHALKGYPKKAAKALLGPKSIALVKGLIRK